MQAAGDGDSKAQNIGGSARREGEQRPAELRRQTRWRLQTTATADGNPATAKRRTQHPAGQGDGTNIAEGCALQLLLMENSHVSKSVD